MQNFLLETDHAKDEQNAELTKQLNELKQQLADKVCAFLLSSRL